MELSIDTSTNTAGIALSLHGEIIEEISWQTEYNHTVELVPKMIHLLESNDKSIRDVKVIIVAQGPGSFNGLRVGIATAKGLAVSLNVPIVSIGTLETIAYPYADTGHKICSILQAGRGEIATSSFQTRNGKWTVLKEAHIASLDDLCSEINDTTNPAIEGTSFQPPYPHSFGDISGSGDTVRNPLSSSAFNCRSNKTMFCGEINQEQLARINQQLGYNALFEEDSNWKRAGYLAALGWCRIDRGDFDDPAALQPLYLRKPSITKPKRRNHDAMSNMQPRSR